MPGGALRPPHHLRFSRISARCHPLEADLSRAVVQQGAEPQPVFVFRLRAPGRPIPSRLRTRPGPCGCEILSRRRARDVRRARGGAITVEKSLHDGFLKDFGLPEDAVDRVPATPTTLAYTSYLLRVASLSDYHEVLAAGLPCYWIYERVGKTLLENVYPEPRYQKWIDTYGGEDFGALVEAVLNLTDKACEGLSPEHRARAIEAFVTTARYEWMFWDAAWRREDWPV